MSSNESYEIVEEETTVQVDEKTQVKQTTNTEGTNKETGTVKIGEREAMEIPKTELHKFSLASPDKKAFVVDSSKNVTNTNEETEKTTDFGKQTNKKTMEVTTEVEKKAQLPTSVPRQKPEAPKIPTFAPPDVKTQVETKTTNTTTIKETTTKPPMPKVDLGAFKVGQFTKLADKDIDLENTQGQRAGPVETKEIIKSPELTRPVSADPNSKIDMLKNLEKELDDKEKQRELSRTKYSRPPDKSGQRGSKVLDDLDKLRRLEREREEQRLKELQIQAELDRIKELERINRLDEERRLKQLKDLEEESLRKAREKERLERERNEQVSSHRKILVNDFKRNLASDTHSERSYSEKSMTDEQRDEMLKSVLGIVGAILFIIISAAVLKAFVFIPPAPVPVTVPMGPAGLLAFPPGFYTTMHAMAVYNAAVISTAPPPIVIIAPPVLPQAITALPSGSASGQGDHSLGVQTNTVGNNGNPSTSTASDYSVNSGVGTLVKQHTHTSHAIEHKNAINIIQTPGTPGASGQTHGPTVINNYNQAVHHSHYINIYAHDDSSSTVVGHHVQGANLSSQNASFLNQKASANTNVVPIIANEPATNLPPAPMQQPDQALADLGKEGQPSEGPFQQSKDTAADENGQATAPNELENILAITKPKENAPAKTTEAENEEKAKEVNPQEPPSSLIQPISNPPTSSDQPENEPEEKMPTLQQLIGDKIKEDNSEPDKQKEPEPDLVPHSDQSKPDSNLANGPQKLEIDSKEHPAPVEEPVAIKEEGKSPAPQIKPQENNDQQPSDRIKPELVPSNETTKPEVAGQPDKKDVEENKPVINPENKTGELGESKIDSSEHLPKDDSAKPLAPNDKVNEEGSSENKPSAVDLEPKKETDSKIPENKDSSNLEDPKKEGEDMLDKIIPFINEKITEKENDQEPKKQEIRRDSPADEKLNSKKETSKETSTKIPSGDQKGKTKSDEKGSDKSTKGSKKSSKEKNPEDEKEDEAAKNALPQKLEDLIKKDNELPLVEKHTEADLKKPEEDASAEEKESKDPNDKAIQPGQETLGESSAQSGPKDSGNTTVNININNNPVPRQEEKGASKSDSKKSKSKEPKSKNDEQSDKSKAKIEPKTDSPHQEETAPKENPPSENLPEHSPENSANKSEQPPAFAKPPEVNILNVNNVSLPPVENKKDENDTKKSDKDDQAKSPEKEGKNSEDSSSEDSSSDESSEDSEKTEKEKTDGKDPLAKPKEEAKPEKEDNKDKQGEEEKLIGDNKEKIPPANVNSVEDSSDEPDEEDYAKSPEKGEKNPEDSSSDEESSENFEKKKKEKKDEKGPLAKPNEEAKPEKETDKDKQSAEEKSIGDNEEKIPPANVNPIQNAPDKNPVDLLISNPSNRLSPEEKPAEENPASIPPLNINVSVQPDKTQPPVNALPSTQQTQPTPSQPAPQIQNIYHFHNFETQHHVIIPHHIIIPHEVIVKHHIVYQNGPNPEAAPSQNKEGQEPAGPAKKPLSQKAEDSAPLLRSYVHGTDNFDRYHNLKGLFNPPEENDSDKDEEEDSGQAPSQKEQEPSASEDKLNIIHKFEKPGPEDIRPKITKKRVFVRIHKQIGFQNGRNKLAKSVPSANNDFLRMKRNGFKTHFAKVGKAKVEVLLPEPPCDENKKKMSAVKNSLI